MSTRRVTIDDVAEAAGVSRQTVSNFIRGQGRVGAATGERIRGIIERLDYTPHPGASSMRSRRSGQVAYPLSPTALTADNVIVMEFTRSLVAEAGAHGYHVLLTSTGARGMRDLVRSGRVDGFVFSDMFHAEDDERIEIVRETHIPFASFGRVPDDLRQAWVDVDNAAGTHSTTQHVVGLGHREITFFGHQIAYWDDERREGYLACMAEYGLAPRVVNVFNSQAAMDAAALGILNTPDRPTAVVCSSDSLALSVYRAAAQLGLVIGRDLSVSGFDSSVIGRSLVPSLTTVRVPVDRIGELVVQRFIAELRSPDDPVEGALVVPHLLPAASTAPPVPAVR